MVRRNSSEPPPHAPMPGERPHADKTLFEKGLPVSLDTEKFVLGSILLNDRLFPTVAAALSREDFGLDAHRRIFSRMGDLYDRQQGIDRVTVADELIKQGQLESVGGLSALVALDEGLPEIAKIDSYINILKAYSSRRKLMFSSQKVIDRCLNLSEEPDAIAESAEKDCRSVRESLDTGRSAGRNPGRIIADFPGGIGAFLDPELRPKGLPYGFRRLDELTTGMHKGELIIIAARPRIGKSALALNIARHAALQLNRRADYFSFEMSAESLLTRLMCSDASVDLHRFRSGYLNQEERRRLQEAIADAADSPLMIWDQFKKTLSQVARRIRQSVKDGCELVVIDQISLMTTNARETNRQAVVSDITRELKLLTGECGIPIIAINQIGRSAENRTGGNGKPQLEDLKASGSLEEDADTVLLIDREEVRKRDRKDLQGKADFILAKQRNGMEATIPMLWEGRHSRFRDRSEEDDQAEENS